VPDVPEYRDGHDVSERFIEQNWDLTVRSAAYLKTLS
jgi:hypothetical protein